MVIGFPIKPCFVGEETGSDREGANAMWRFFGGDLTLGLNLASDLHFL